MRRETPPQMRRVTDEPVLAHQIGDGKATYTRSNRLLEQSGHPTTNLQVLPQSEGMSLNYGFLPSVDR